MRVAHKVAAGRCPCAMVVSVEHKLYFMHFGAVPDVYAAVVLCPAAMSARRRTSFAEAAWRSQACN